MLVIQPPPGGRRYTSIACEACRKRKIRCDNKSPQCSNCVHFGTDCVFGRDRRKSASASKAPGSTIHHVARTVQGVSTERSPGDEQSGHPENLESPTAIPLSTENRTDDLYPEGFEFSEEMTGYEGADMNFWIKMAACPGDANPINEPPLLERMESNSENNSNSSSRFEALLNAEFNTYLPSFESIQDEESNDIDSGVRLGIGESDIQSRGGCQKNSPQHEQTTDDVDDEITQRLSSRLGRLQIAEDGQIRYYGATSNLHMIRNGLFSLFQPNLRSVRTDGEAALRQAGLEWSGDANYEEHLTKLYFAWSNPFLGTVNQSVYRHQKHLFETDEVTPFYSPTLQNAILAVGASYTGRHHPGIKGKPSEFFGFRTKALLDIEMDSPTLATIEALVILSSHEAVNARDSRGWLYCGMAVQLLTDLGLHLQIEDSYCRMNVANEIPNIANLRNSLFWTVRTLDTFWSSYSGRPGLMQNLDYNISGPIPTETIPWEPYIDDSYYMKIPAELDVTIVDSTYVYLAQLSTKIQKISKVLYNGVPSAGLNIQLFVQGMVRELERWRESLPTAFRIDTSQSEEQSCLPAVIELNLQYHEVMILLHRPFISEVRPDQTTPDSEGKASSIDGGPTCTNSASEICQLLLLYSHQWNLSRIHGTVVHIIMTAGLIHAYNCCIFADERGRHAQEHLITCIQALGEMARSFRSSTRALEVIMSLKRDWHDQVFSQVRGKRPRGAFRTLSHTLDVAFPANLASVESGSV